MVTAMEKNYFPVFVDITGARVLVAGGGKIALRRVSALLKFGADICVVAPHICADLMRFCEEGRIEIKKREYQKGDITGARFVLAATDKREVNRMIREECREAGIMVNVSDDRSLCDFHFPGLVVTEDTVVGVNCGGENHKRAKETRMKIEETLKNL